MSQHIRNNKYFEALFLPIKNIVNGHFRNLVVQLLKTIISLKPMKFGKMFLKC